MPLHAPACLHARRSPSFFRAARPTVITRVPLVRTLPGVASARPHALFIYSRVVPSALICARLHRRPTQHTHPRTLSIGPCNVRANVQCHAKKTANLKIASIQESNLRPTVSRHKKLTNRAMETIRQDPTRKYLDYLF